MNGGLRDWIQNCKIIHSRETPFFLHVQLFFKDIGRVLVIKFNRFEIFQLLPHISLFIRMYCALLLGLGLQ